MPISTNNLTFNIQFDGGTLDGNTQRTPILFLNSLGSDLRSWDSVVSLLLKNPAFANRPLIRYDKRGHGLSDCPPAPYTVKDHATDLAGIIDTLGLEKIILVGISVGGMIAMQYAADHTERVTALVLCDTAAKIGTLDGWNARIDTLRQHGMHYLAESILQRWFAPAFIQTRPALYNIYYNMLTRTPVEGYTGTCEAIRDADLHPLLKHITAPVLVLCGEEDQATTPAVCQQLADRLSNATYQGIKSAAHLPCIEQPTLFTSVLTRFLQNLK